MLIIECTILYFGLVICGLATGLVLMYTEGRDFDHPRPEDYLTTKDLDIFDKMISVYAKHAHKLDGIAPHEAN